MVVIQAQVSSMKRKLGPRDRDTFFLGRQVKDGDILKLWTPSQL